MGVTHQKQPAQNWQPYGAVMATQTGAGVFAQTLNIGTTAEAVSFGDVSPGLVILYNLDDTNFVNFGMSDGGTLKAIGRLYPTTRWPAMFFLMPGQTLMMQADTLACEVHVVAYEL
jgi:hypothetical protein